MPKVKVGKIIKAERGRVFSTITDFENLPSKLPEFFKSVKVVSKDGRELIFQYVLTTIYKKLSNNFGFNI